MNTIPTQPIASWGFPFRDIFLIAGPCSVESPEQVLRTAQGLCRFGIQMLRGGIWKPRTRPNSFEGVGAEGLRWLKEAGRETGLPVSTEVASPEHVEQALHEGIDALWIGARTSVNPFSVQAIADALRGHDIPVMVKNPVNPDLELWIGAFERLAKAGIRRLGAIHRGFSTFRTTEYRNIPNWRIPIELKRRVPDMPILCDPSHICGDTFLLLSVAQEAIDLLFDGLIVEVHENPAQAKSDGKQQLTPDQFGSLLKAIVIKRKSSDSEEFIRHLGFLRKEVDELDNQIIESLGRRMEIVKDMGLYKQKNAVSTFQPGRWEEIVQSRVRAGMAKNLDADFVLQMYEIIHEEAIRIQESIDKK